MGNAAALPRVAVVGAGLAGLACARALADRGVEVTVFDKGRSVGGRLATRRIPPHTFDLGAQYFTARDERFARQVRAWSEAGVCASWGGRIVALDGDRGTVRPVEPVERLVGTPDMSALSRAMATDLDVRTGHRVERITRLGDHLVLSGTTAPTGVTLPPATADALAPAELGSYDTVVLCVPSNQAAPLLDALSPRLAREARSAPLEPCFAVGFVAGDADEAALRALAFDGAFIGREGEAVSSLLTWAARDSSKPGRPPGERWVLHASSVWSRASFDLPESEVTDELIGELARLFDLGRLRPALTCVRRWSLAKAPTPLDRGALFDEEARVGLGGDWACGGRIEGAFLSGLELADRVLDAGAR
jgi:hypothetical protein